MSIYLICLWDIRQFDIFVVVVGGVVDPYTTNSTHSSCHPGMWNIEICSMQAMTLLVRVSDKMSGSE